MSNSITGQPSTVASPKRPKHVDVKASDGFSSAHNDLIHYLRESHGIAFDFCMAKVDSIGFNRDYLTYAGYAFIAVYLVFGCAARLMCNFIGFGYPMYASVKAIRTHDTDDDTRWLIYWTCFAVLCIFDFFSESIFRYFPFYFVIKAAFLIYLYLPQTQGSFVFYENVVEPLVLFIDAVLAKYLK